MFAVVNDHVFPFLRTLAGDDSTYAHHMKDARFTIPTPALLAKVVDMIDQVPMEDRDTKGDLYEYMLGKIASAGQNGQFRTPRHIIQLMVEMVAPQPADTICDPASRAAGSPLSALCRFARFRKLRQGPPTDCEDQEDRAALPRPLPAPPQARRTRRRHCARRRALRLLQRAQDPAKNPGRGTETRRRHLLARRR